MGIAFNRDDAVVPLFSLLVGLLALYDADRPARQHAACKGGFVHQDQLVALKIWRHTGERGEIRRGLLFRR